LPNGALTIKIVCRPSKPATQLRTVAPGSSPRRFSAQSKVPRTPTRAAILFGYGSCCLCHLELNGRALLPIGAIIRSPSVARVGKQ
jgi:hypothetical protein